MPVAAAPAAIFIAGVIKGALIGAAVGAVVGAAASALKGGNILEGAVNGAMAGFVTGAAAGAIGGAASAAGQGAQGADQGIQGAAGAADAVPAGPTAGGRTADIALSQKGSIAASAPSAAQVAADAGRAAAETGRSIAPPPQATGGDSQGLLSRYMDWSKANPEMASTLKETAGGLIKGVGNALWEQRMQDRQAQDLLDLENQRHQNSQINYNWQDMPRRILPRAQVYTPPQWFNRQGGTE